MIVCYPSYYEKFACIAGECEDTCCAGWEIDIDDKSYQYYMSIEGEFGERLRRSIKEYCLEDEGVYEQHGFILRGDKRCPFLDDKGLCDLYRELGKDALCEVCTDTPRNFLEYGGQREISLSAACAEAGRLLYSSEDKIRFIRKESAEKLDLEETEEELNFAHKIRTARDRAVRILQNRELALDQRILCYLAYAAEVQGYLNENESEKILTMAWEQYMEDILVSENKWRDALGTVTGKEQYHMFLRRMVTFTGLDSICAEWEDLLRQLHTIFVEDPEGEKNYDYAVCRLSQELKKQHREYEYEHLMVYYVFLCQSRCVDDYDFIGRAVLAVVSFLMIRDIDALRIFVTGAYTREDRVEIARIYAREVEHSEDNLEYLADEFLFEEEYKTESLMKAFLHP